MLTRPGLAKRPTPSFFYESLGASCWWGLRLLRVLELGVFFKLSCSRLLSAPKVRFLQQPGQRPSL